jgi:hypothetical protein
MATTIRTPLKVPGETRRCWQTSDDPNELLDLLQALDATPYGPPGVDRKLRLFCCGCCRAPGFLEHDRQREALDRVEAWVDGGPRPRLTGDLWSGVWSAYYQDPWGGWVSRQSGDPDWRDAPPGSAWSGARSWAHFGEPVEVNRGGFDRPDMAHVWVGMPALLRCLFGDPFGPAVRLPGACPRCGGAGRRRNPAPPEAQISPWVLCCAKGKGLSPALTPLVRRLAEQIYAGRAFDRLPVLADAAEEAGVDDPALLGHLRSPGPHARGCWALDLLAWPRPPRDPS